MKRQFSTILLSILPFITFSQSNYQCIVSFTDKDNSPFKIEEPQHYLSERSINRRYKQGISVNESDLPLNPSYVKEIADISTVEIVSKSKWFNDVVIALDDTNIVSKIRSKDFVESVRYIPSSKDKSTGFIKRKKDSTMFSELQSHAISAYGDAFRQISMLNADYLHLLGYMGENMRIAIIDAGFSQAWSSPHFAQAYKEHRIIDEYDFVDKEEDPYKKSYHGSYVLSTIAAYTPGTMIGTAPSAEYLLLRSEDGSAEYILEEFFWTEAAEFADSAGADIINTSLGYSDYDDSLQSHSYSDLDGKSTRITQSSTIACTKGMLLFNSAGNEGASSWQKINAPADAEDVLTVGSVDSSRTLSSFSSRGPTYDGRIKPDVMAMGQAAIIGRSDGTVSASNGTSFSSPILSGAAACLWQANPNKTWKEVREAIVVSGHRYDNADTNYGYGIPDMIRADELLKGINRSSGISSLLRTFPNPFIDDLMVVFRLPRNQQMQVEIYNELGQLAGKYSKAVEAGNSSFLYLGHEVSNLSSGLYILKLSSADLNEEIKIMKE